MLDVRFMLLPLGIYKVRNKGFCCLYICNQIEENSYNIMCNLVITKFCIV